MDKLQIELLGPIRLLADGKRLGARLGKKTLGVLALLALSANRRFSREELVEFFWPDRFDTQGRQSLRQALSILRKALGDDFRDLLLSEDDCVGLNPDRFEIDIDRFDSLAASADLDDQIAAAALYRSDFAAGLISVSPAFDDWAERLREIRRSKVVACLKSIALQLRDKSELVAALEAAEHLIAIDPASEAGHRLLMELYAQHGRRSTALRQYRSCCRELARHLDAEPDEETKALFEKIQSGAIERRAESSVRGGVEGAISKNIRKIPKKFRLSRMLFRHRSLVATGAMATLFAFIVGGYVVSGSSFESYGAGAPSPQAPIALCDRLKKLSPSVEPVLLIPPLRYVGDTDSDMLTPYIVTDAIVSTVAFIPGVEIILGPDSSHEDSGLGYTELAQKNSATHILVTTLTNTEGDGIKMTLRIIEAASGRQIWQDVRDRNAGDLDLSAIQRDFALSAWQGVHETLTDGQQALMNRLYEPVTPEIVAHTTKGFGYLNLSTPLHNQLARAEFARALSLDANHPGANAGMGYTIASPIFFRWQPYNEDDAALAAEYARRALNHRDDYVPALSLLALTELFRGNIEEAVSIIEKAVSENGAAADATAIYAYILTYTPDVEDSVALAAKAMHLRPYAHPDWYEWVFARALRVNNELDGAVDCLKRIDFQERSAVAPALEAALAHLALGERRKARRYITMIKPHLDDDFMIESYCNWPKAPEISERTDACVEALDHLGL